ncbi:ATPase [Sphingomonas piscis]|uniref:ATP synthase subunit b n=1 Tax=Sphingomonas piscis TaxID=2714943 RepID=A0A6G7YRQ4_9SPHN|nr:ATPase [Sphingomonas piscis]QIK79411.1 ATPase [Sphingomonas piscis]
MPQIAQIGEIYLSQLIWLAVFFGLIFLVVGLGMLPKIQGTVDARNQRIAADLAEAQAARERADALEQAYRDKLDQARADAARVATDAKAQSARSTEARVAEADQAISGKVEAAQSRIAEVRAAAMAEIEAVAADAAKEIVHRVAGLTVDDGAVRSAVARELVNG